MCIALELIGRRNRVGETETGVVYEQSMRIFDKEGRAIKIRRVTVVLHQPRTTPRSIC